MKLFLLLVFTYLSIFSANAQLSTEISNEEHAAALHYRLTEFGESGMAILTKIKSLSQDDVHSKSISYKSVKEELTNYYEELLDYNQVTHYGEILEKHPEIFQLFHIERIPSLFYIFSFDLILGNENGETLSENELPYNKDLRMLKIRMIAQDTVLEIVNIKNN